MDNMVVFAQRLKRQREKKGMTQARLAEQIGVSSQTISAYEKNISGEKGKTPTLDKVISLAQVLGVSIDYLCGIDFTEKERTMNSLRDIVECLTQIATYVDCYGGVRTRKLSEEECLGINCDVPDEYVTSKTDMAVFTMDNHILAHFFGTKNKLLELYKDGAIERELYSSVIEGQLSNLQSFKISKIETAFIPDGIDTDKVISE